MAQSDFTSVDEYIASKPEATRAVLISVRNAIRKALPAADESISYKMPTYKVKGRPALYFAGWTRHFSIYPATPSLVAAFKAELGPYKVNKGTIRFPLSDAPPVKLIEKIATFRGNELGEQPTA